MRRIAFSIAIFIALIIGLLLRFVFHDGHVLSPPADGSTSLPTFTPVNVHARESQQGFSLSGTVLDAQGAAIDGAQVSVVSSSQRTLTGAQCDICKAKLLTCRAHETTRTVARLLEKQQGLLQGARTTHTDTRGHFVFTGLAGTSFDVWAKAPGFAEGLKERAAPGDPLTLHLPLPRVLNGRLQDALGKPVPGTVRALSLRLARLIEVQTDADGTFTLPGLGEGPFYILATAPPLLPTSLEAGLKPITLTMQKPRRLELRLLAQGQPIDAVVRLRGDHVLRELAAKGGFLAIDALYPDEFLVSAIAGELAAVAQPVTLNAAVTQRTLHLGTGGRLVVTAIDELGAPVLEPTLTLYTRSGKALEKRQLATGELGLFGPLAIGEYLLQTTAAGYNTNRLPISMKAQETSVLVTLSQTTVLSGRVTDAYGRLAPGVSVLVHPTGDNVLTNAQGRFQASVPSPGLYVLHAHHSDWGGGKVRVIAPKADIQLALEPKAGAEVTVRADGRQVEGAHVTLLHTQGGHYRSDRPSGADGVVLLRGLPADTYTLIATHPAYLPSDKQTFVLHDDELVRMTAALKVGADITGQVLDTQGTPVANATVSLMPRRSAKLVSTQTDGTFELSPLKVGRQYHLRAIKRGYNQLNSVVAVAGQAAARIILKRQPIFEGRVLADGQPLKHFRVDAQEVHTPDGRFKLPLSASDGRVVVTIEAFGYELLVADRPNTPNLGDFTLTPAPMVTGVVYDKNFTPVAHAVVSCISCEHSVLTDANGNFALSKPSFRHEFTVRAKKGRHTAAKKVTDDALQGLDLVLQTAVRLHGTAWLPDGSPAGGVELLGINVEHSESISVVTDSTGRFSSEVPRGTYRLMVRGIPTLPVLITQVAAPATALHFGMAPHFGKLSVRITPRKRFALWLVRGEVATPGNPSLALLHADYAQYVYEPKRNQVTFGGLVSGRYTLVWGDFYAKSGDDFIKIPVHVPMQTQINLPR